MPGRPVACAGDMCSCDDCFAHQIGGDAIGLTLRIHSRVPRVPRAQSRRRGPEQLGQLGFWKPAKRSGHSSGCSVACTAHRRRGGRSRSGFLAHNNCRLHVLSGTAVRKSLRVVSSLAFPRMNRSAELGCCLSASRHPPTSPSRGVLEYSKSTRK